ncbi:MAG: TetR/AcrR family transcriptional regulator [Pseudomonadota bacterium]
MSKDSASTDTAPAKPNRQARRKQRTRALLIKVANEVFLAKGVDGASVTDITDEADVAYGTFYNYFNSVEEIVTASVEQVISEINDEISTGLRESTDPALQLAYGLRDLFKRFVQEPAFKWLIQKPDLFADAIFRTAAASAAEDITNGIESGDFELTGGLPTVQNFCVWGFTGAMRQIAESPDEVEEITDDVLRAFLRILGVSDSKAQKAVEKSRVH